MFFDMWTATKSRPICEHRKNKQTIKPKTKQNKTKNKQKKNKTAQERLTHPR